MTKDQMLAILRKRPEQLRYESDGLDEHGHGQEGTRVMQHITVIENVIKDFYSLTDQRAEDVFYAAMLGPVQGHPKGCDCICCKEEEN